MASRNLSPQQMFMALAEEKTPRFHFTGTSLEDVQQWKKAALPAVIKTLGDFPERVEANAKLIAEWKQDNLIKQRWLIDVSKHSSAVLLICKPKGIALSDNVPAILCCHGHGPFGKDPVMGNNSSVELRQEIEKCNYDYGHQMAKAGFITFAIDGIGFGDRSDSKIHNLRINPGSRDWCNLYYLHATMLGMTPLSINITHCQAAMDHICTMEEVDTKHIGVMGLSAGGTMALWMTLCEPRIKASEIICYSELWANFGIRDLNYCGAQVAPGLYKVVDLPELQGLIVPRPLLINIGAHDHGFRLENAMACHKQLEAIYKAAGASEKLELDLHSGDHAWGGNLSVKFFKKHLNAEHCEH